MGGATTSSPGDFLKLARPFKVIAFDWDGTAVTDRRADASRVCEVFDRLLQQGTLLVVITGTNAENAVRQLGPVLPRPWSRNLFLATNRGSEVWGFDGAPRAVPVWKREATADEERQLSRAAELLRDRLSRHGVSSRIIYNRLNRRKIDIIPLPEWEDPPKSAIGTLLEAVQRRLSVAGVPGGIQGVLRLADEVSREAGLGDPRITSDVKHIEIGLTDKADSIEWMVGRLCAERGVQTEEILIAGDEFGWIGGVEGSDHRMVTPHSKGAVFVSVGPEPGGLPPGIIHLGGGPERFRTLLESLASVRATAAGLPGTLPLTPTADPAWLLVQEGFDPAREHEFESLLAIGNGYLGCRGSLAEGTGLSSSPATFLAGVFDTPARAPAVPEFALAPEWTRLRLWVGGHELRLDSGTVVEHRRTLDYKQGVSWRTWTHRTPDGRVTRLRGLRLASLDDRHVVLQSLEITPENYSGPVRLEATVEPAGATVAGLTLDRPRLQPAADARARAWTDPVVLTYRAPAASHRVAFASTCRLSGLSAPAARTLRREDGACTERWEFDARMGESCRFDRIGAFFTTRDADQPAHEAARRVVAVAGRGPDDAARAHARAWSARWGAADIEVEGDDEAAQALRFAAYHLVSAANPQDERVSIGARTLTGDSYKGHVFWDTDIFMVPFFVFTDPAAARALLRYRVHTLPAARARARGFGYPGALYAWESADTGEETTPRFMLSPQGEVIKILSGLQEHHISCDVAYAVWQYWQATRDVPFMLEGGVEILVETARFWAARGAFGDDGRYHIGEIIGPDEYHEGIDDNAYTNVLARWNIERALEGVEWMRARHPRRWDELRARAGVGDDEPARWARAAAHMYTGLDERTGLYEQFRGFLGLEDYDLAPMRATGRRAASLDMLLGRERTLRSQIVKQADVVMMLDLLWESFPPHVRETNFRYYEPRTCHGSSLSPATHALVAARLGDMEMARDYFVQAARIDLGNNMGNASGGVHAAALGGLWRATVFGFAGVHVRDDELALQPRLPAQWQSLRVPLQWRGEQLHLSLGRRGSTVHLRVDGHARTPLRLVAAAGEQEIETGRDYAVDHGPARRAAAGAAAARAAPR